MGSIYTTWAMSVPSNHNSGASTYSDTTNSPAEMTLLLSRMSRFDWGDQFEWEVKRERQPITVLDFLECRELQGTTGSVNATHFRCLLRCICPETFEG